MTTRYPSLAQRKQTAKRRDQSNKTDFEAAKTYDPNAREPERVIEHAESLLPDLPGKVHGIVSLDPPGVQCDGCGYVHTAFTLALTVQTGPRFYRRTPDRLCRDCAEQAGFEVER